MSPTLPPASIPVRDGSRDSSAANQPGRGHCPVCTAALPSPRARYCSAACRQRAYRGRQPKHVEAGTVGQRYRRTAAGGGVRFTAQPAVTQTVYACPLCEARFLGQQRCSDCNRFCRRVGPGGPCPHCDEPVALADLLTAIR